jgi:hypothetical protein
VCPIMKSETALLFLALWNGVMLARRRRRLIHPLQASPIASIPALLLAAVPAAAHIALDMGRLGNVFAPGERISLTISSDLPSLSWSVTDFYGSELRKGTLSITDGRARLTLNFVQPGWFELTARAVGALGENAQTTFVVMPRPARLAGTRFGVMTHFAQGWDTDVLPLVARAGIAQVRDEIYWQNVETSPGHYAIPPYARVYLAALAHAGLKLQLILSFANSLYDNGDTPHTEGADKAFEAYALYLVGALGPQLTGVEVWNEFNGSFCKGPCVQDRPGAYTRLLAATFPAIKAVAPALPVGGGAAVLAPLPWFEALAERGALHEMDAMVIHPYHDVPEGVGVWVQNLEALSASHGQTIPIWATEFSRSANGPGGRRDQARFLVREAATLVGEGTTRIDWYLLRDYAQFVGMGLLAAPDSPLGRYSPSPAYMAYATLIREIGDLPSRGNEVDDPRTRLYRFGDGVDAVRIAWSAEGSARLSIAAPGPIEIVDIMGRMTKHSPVGGRIEVALGADPIYLRGAVDAVREEGLPPLLADSVAQFPDGPEHKEETGGPASLTTAGAWSYGAYSCPEPESVADRCVQDFADAGEPLEPLNWDADQWSWAWRSGKLPFLGLSREGAHPSALSGHPVWAVRRWVPSRPARVRVTVDASRGAGGAGDGSGVMVLVDGRPVLQKLLGGPGRAAEAHFTIDLDLGTGAKLDFVTTPGPAANINYDATSFRIRVEE